MSVKLEEGDMLYLDSKKGYISFLRDSETINFLMAWEIIIPTTNAVGSFTNNILWTQVCGNLVGSAFGLKAHLQKANDGTETAKFMFEKI